jgi:hypothetical protein
MRRIYSYSTIGRKQNVVAPVYLFYNLFIIRLFQVCPSRPLHATRTPLGFFFGYFVSFVFTHSFFIVHFFGFVFPLAQYYELLKVCFPLVFTRSTVHALLDSRSI